MAPEETHLDAELRRALEAEARAEADGPLGAGDFSEEELLAYLDGELAAGEEEALQARLAASPEGTAKLLRLQELVNAEPPTDDASTEAVAAGLSDLRARLSDGDNVQPFPTRRRHRGAWLPIAATLVAGLAMAAFWLAPWLKGGGSTVMANVRVPLESSTFRGGGVDSYPSAGSGVEVLLETTRPLEARIEPKQVLYLKLLSTVESESCRATVELPSGDPVEVQGLWLDGPLAYLAVHRPIPGSYRILLRCDESAAVDRFALDLEIVVSPRTSARSIRSTDPG